MVRVILNAIILFYVIGYFPQLHHQEIELPFFFSFAQVFLNKCNNTRLGFWFWFWLTAGSSCLVSFCFRSVLLQLLIETKPNNFSTLSYAVIRSLLLSGTVGTCFQAKEFRLSHLIAPVYRRSVNYHWLWFSNSQSGNLQFGIWKKHRKQKERRLRLWKKWLASEC